MFLEKKDGSHRPGLGLPTLCLSSFCSWNGWLGLFVRVALIYNPQPGISSSSSNDRAFLAFVYQASNKHLEGKEKQKPCFLKNIRGNIPRKTLVFKSAPLDYLQEIESKCSPPHPAAKKKRYKKQAGRQSKLLKGILRNYHSIAQKSCDPIFPTLPCFPHWCPFLLV